MDTSSLCTWIREYVLRFLENETSNVRDLQK